jgi:sugar O-acyltransferase (sialic acid O-acetyltransferase NeuD family)
MITTPVNVIIGSGGHGREALDVAERSGISIDGFISDSEPPKKLIEKYGTKWLGDVEFLKTYGNNVGYVIAIGDCDDKKSVDDRLVGCSCQPINIISRLASFGSHCKIGSGVMMYDGARVTTNVTLGRHVHLNVNSVVSHDCVVGDYSIVSPGAILNGNVTVGKRTFIGTGAVVLPKITIGDNVIIGAGAVVTKDVPSNRIYVGIPARSLYK